MDTPHQGGNAPRHETKKANLPERLEAKLADKYRQNIVNNVHRGEVVECLVDLALGDGWILMSEKRDDWAPWDMESDDGVRIQIKQSAALQRWHDWYAPKRPGNSFDIKRPRRADIFVLAWHGEKDPDRARHLDGYQWTFLVVPETELPPQDKIAVSVALKKLARFKCGFDVLRDRVENARPSPSESKRSIETQGSVE